MRFVWIGFLKKGAPPVQQDVQARTIDFLQQPFIDIQGAGALRDESGERAGMIMIFDADNRAAAQALAQESPYLQAGLYDEYHLFEFQNEVG
jgi:uncharacterized protein YciI